MRRRFLAIGLVGIALAFATPDTRSIIAHSPQQSRVEQVIIQARGYISPLVATLTPLQQVGLAGLNGFVSWTQLHGAPTTIKVDGKPVAIDTKSDFSLKHGCSLTGDEVDAILRAAGSPVAGKGSVFQEACVRTGIDDAYVLAMFRQESSYGTDPAYHYLARHNTGNIMGSDGPEFYGTWEEGINAHFDVLAYYRDKLGKADVEQAIYTWAPPTEIELFSIRQRRSSNLESSP